MSIFDAFTDFFKRPSLRTAVPFASTIAGAVLGNQFGGGLTGAAIGGAAGGGLSKAGLEAIFGPETRLSGAISAPPVSFPAGPAPDKTTFSPATGIGIPQGVETGGTPLQQSTGIATRATEGSGGAYRGLSAQNYLLDQIKRRLIPSQGGAPTGQFQPIEVRNLTEVLGGRPREESTSSILSAYERALEQYAA